MSRVRVRAQPSRRRRRAQVLLRVRREIVTLLPFRVRPRDASPRSRRASSDAPRVVSYSTCNINEIASRERTEADMCIYAVIFRIKDIHYAMRARVQISSVTFARRGHCVRVVKEVRAARPRRELRDSRVRRSRWT